MAVSKPHQGAIAKRKSFKNNVAFLARLLLQRSTGGNVLTTTALMVLGGMASLLGSLYGGWGGSFLQAGDVVLAVGTAAGIAYSRTGRRE